MPPAIHLPPVTRPIDLTTDHSAYNPAEVTAVLRRCNNAPRAISAGVGGGINHAVPRLWKLIEQVGPVGDNLVQDSMEGGHYDANRAQGSNSTGPVEIFLLGFVQHTAHKVQSGVRGVSHLHFKVVKAGHHFLDKVLDVGGYGMVGAMKCVNHR